MTNFDPNIMPPQQRDAKHRQAHLEMLYQSLDTVAVYNPTDNDFRVTYDAAVSGEAYVVPNKNRDIGYGKGILHCKRYVARLYVNRMGKLLIRKKSQVEWSKQKSKYRLDEQGQYEERLALRVTDSKAWEDILPKIFLGVVEKYRPGVESLPVKERRTKRDITLDDTLDRIGLYDKKIEQEDIDLEPIDQNGELGDEKERLINDNI